MGQRLPVHMLAERFMRRRSLCVQCRDVTKRRGSDFCSDECEEARAEQQALSM